MNAILQVYQVHSVLLVRALLRQSLKCRVTERITRIEHHHIFPENVHSQTDASSVFLPQVTDGVISGGLNGILLFHLQDHLGFSLTLIPVPGVNGTSHWTRTFSAVSEGAVDLSPSSWTVRHDRHELVDFSIPTVTVSVGFGIRRPHGEADPSAFLRPFDVSAYVGVMVVVVMLAAVAWRLDRRSRIIDAKSKRVVGSPARPREGDKVKSGSNASGKVQRRGVRMDTSRMLSNRSARRRSIRSNVWTSESRIHLHPRKHPPHEEKIESTSTIITKKNQRYSSEDAKPETISATLWLLTIFGSLSLQGSALSLKRPISRVILLTGFTTGILICNYYNSGLYSHLTAMSPAMPFSSVAELFRDKTFTIGAQESVYFTGTISQMTGLSESEVQHRLDDHMALHDRDVQRLIARPRSAFMMTSTAFKIAVLEPPWRADRCPSCFVPIQEVSAEERAIIFRKGLERERGIMDRMLLKMWESGVLARERARWLPETLRESYR